MELYIPPGRLFGGFRLEHGHLKHYLLQLVGALVIPAVVYASDHSLPLTNLLKLGLLLPFYSLAYRGLNSWFPTEVMAQSNMRLAEYAALYGFSFAILMVFVRDLTQWGGQTDLRSILLQLLVTTALMSCLIFASGFIAKRSNKKEKGGSS